MASGYEYAVTPSPAPAEPEFPRWPLWYPLVALFGGFAAGILVVDVAAGAAGAKLDSPGVTAAGTAVIDAFVVAAAVLLASMTARPRPWQFGLRRAPLGFTIGMAGLGV